MFRLELDVARLDLCAYLIDRPLVARHHRCALVARGDARLESGLRGLAACDLRHVVESPAEPQAAGDEPGHDERDDDCFDIAQDSHVSPHAFGSSPAPAPAA